MNDDLSRSRVTAFFRLPLSAPHLVWIVLWSVPALCVAVLNWVATLVRGRSPERLHRFLAAYVRYSVHTGAFALLGANPFPGFTGATGYPLDVEIPPPAAQSRWSVGFRLLLFVPAGLVAVELVGWLPFAPIVSVALRAGGTMATVAVLAWFATLARGRMQPGFRDLIGYALRYAAQGSAYLLCLTGAYPTADPLVDRPAARPHTVDVVVRDDLRRSRLTTLLRLPLAIPHLVWLWLWSIGVWSLAPFAWLATLVDGRPPEFFAGFYSAYVRYQTHLAAYLALVARPYPGFLGRADSYPVDATIDASERQNRWTIGFRIVLAVPAWFVVSALSGPLLVVGVLGWLMALVLGRVPVGLRNLGAYALRYSAQTTAYVLLLSGRYPDSGPWLTVLDESAAQAVD